MKSEEKGFLSNYIEKEVKFTGSNFDFFFILHLKNLLLFNCGCHSPPPFNEKQN